MITYDLTQYPWEWDWREDEYGADCGIYAMVREGHAYSVARCPRFLNKEDWERIAQYICDLHNNALTNLLETKPQSRGLRT